MFTLIFHLLLESWNRHFAASTVTLATGINMKFTLYLVYELYSIAMSRITTRYVLHRTQWTLHLHQIQFRLTTCSQGWRVFVSKLELEFRLSVPNVNLSRSIYFLFQYFPNYFSGFSLKLFIMILSIYIIPLINTYNYMKHCQIEHASGLDLTNFTRISL